MSIVERVSDWLFGTSPAPTKTREAREFEPPPGGEWYSILTAGANKTTVTQSNAMTIAAVYACVRVLAESVASLPLKLYRRSSTGKSQATDHRLYSVLHDMANPEMTSFEFRETMMSHLLLWGNCYAEIELSNRNDVLALWPMPANRVEVTRTPGGDLLYVYDRPGEGKVPISAYRMFHVRGLSSNGITGLSPISVARRTLSIAMATEQYGQAFFENGAQLGTMFKHPGKLGTQAYARLKESLDESYTGARNAHRTMILEEGMDVTRAGIPPEDAQFLETRKFQRSEIASIYRVPPHLIQDLDKATFSNIEHQSLDFVVHSLRPWLVRWEQAIARCLIGEVERKSLFAEFSVDGLLRGDIASRYQAYSIGRQWGWLSRNDVRGFENLNTIEGGDDYLTPMNMTVLGEESLEPEPTPPAAQPPPAEDDAMRALRVVAEDAAQRIAARVSDRREAARHSEWMISVLMPIIRALALAGGKPDEGVSADEIVDYWVGNADADWRALAGRIMGN